MFNGAQSSRNTGIVRTDFKSNNNNNNTNSKNTTEREHSAVNSLKNVLPEEGLMTVNIWRQI
jgi:hypothetical protein